MKKTFSQHAKHWWPSVLVALVLPVCLLFIATGIIANMSPLVHSLIDRYSNNPKDAHIALDYYYNYIASESMELPRIEGMTDQELSHLRDVKMVWRNSLAVLAALIGLATAVVATAYKRDQLVWALRVGGALTIIWTIALSVMPFDTFWTWSHDLLFPQGNWRFSYESRIIQNFPPTFFESMVLRVALLALALGAAALAVTYLRRDPSELPAAPPEPVGPGGPAPPVHRRHKRSQ